MPNLTTADREAINAFINAQPVNVSDEDLFRVALERAREACAREIECASPKSDWYHQKTCPNCEHATAIRSLTIAELLEEVRKGGDAMSTMSTITELEAKLRELAELLRKAQWLIHCGQYHQWDSLDKCTNKHCKEVMRIVKEVTR